VGEIILLFHTICTVEISLEGLDLMTLMLMRATEGITLPHICRVSIHTPVLFN
jgi:hypothetical protein